MADSKVSIIAKNFDDLKIESARHRIVQAAIDHIELDRGMSLGKLDVNAVSWGLDFTLHVSL
jgi:hypothetical protein